MANLSPCDLYSLLKPFGYVAEYLFRGNFRQKISELHTAWKETDLEQGEHDEGQELTQVDSPADRSEARIRELENRIRDMQDVLKYYLDMTFFGGEDDKSDPWYKKIYEGGKKLFNLNFFRRRPQRVTPTEEDDLV